MDEPIRKLYVEITSRCNLKCKMCFRHTWVGEQFGDLEPEVFTALLEDPALQETETVFFGGMGEPLVHPALTAMVRAASEKGKRTELITNGTLLSEQRAKELIDAGIREIWVSIDELYENYGRIQVGSSFDTVLKNLTAFNSLRRDAGVRLGMTAVVMRDNIASLDRIRDFALGFDADDLNLSHMVPNRPEDVPNALWSMCDVAAIREATDNSKPSWRLEYLQEGREYPMFRFSARYGEELFGSDHEKQREAELFSWKGKPFLRRVNSCRFIEENNCFIRWDGDVSPCMGLLHSADTYLGDGKRRMWHKAYGNVKTQSLAEIWNSEEYRSFRQRVRDFNFAPCLYCGGCHMLAENKEDCIGSPAPTCGGCLWGQGLIVCP
jgi:MoaA/NifB/PqqE/SkfB family radical SAM enzyme